MMTKKVNRMNILKARQAQVQPAQALLRRPLPALPPQLLQKHHHLLLSQRRLLGAISIIIINKNPPRALRIRIDLTVISNLIVIVIIIKILIQQKRQRHLQQQRRHTFGPKPQKLHTYSANTHSVRPRVRTISDTTQKVVLRRISMQNRRQLRHIKMIIR